LTSSRNDGSWITFWFLEEEKNSCFNQNLIFIFLTFRTSNPVHSTDVLVHLLLSTEETSSDIPSPLSHITPLAASDAQQGVEFLASHALVMNKENFSKANAFANTLALVSNLSDKGLPGMFDTVLKVQTEVLKGSDKPAEEDAVVFGHVCAIFANNISSKDLEVSIANTTQHNLTKSFALSVFLDHRTFHTQVNL
jgi:hypothetical protein